MQTTYYKRPAAPVSQGNLVDLAQFRQKMCAAQRDNLARRLEEDREETGFRPVVLTLTREERRRARRERQAWTLDLCASLAVVAMTLVFTLRILL